MSAANLFKPWTIDATFDAETAALILDCHGFEVCECNPAVTEEWMKDEISRVQAMRATPEMLDALKLIRKLGYASKLETAGNTVLRCIAIAEYAISAAEPVPATKPRPSGDQEEGGK